MAYTFIERYSVQNQNFLATLAADLVTMGWTIYDHSVAHDLIMRMNTSEGPGNEIYYRLRHINNALTGNTFESYLGTGWNLGTKSFIGEYIFHSEHHFGQAATTTATISYWLTGDEDHFILSGWADGSTYRAPPLYVGLLDKYHPEIDPTPQCATILSRYVTTTSSPYYDVTNRMPLLRAWNGQFNGYGRMCKETLFHRDRDHEDFLGFGPWGPDNYISTSMASVWENNWGMRGYIKNVRIVSGANTSTLSLRDTVMINGDEYYFWRSDVLGTAYGQYSAWNLYQNATGDHHHGLFIRKTNNFNL